MSATIIGIDPHKRSHTAVVLDDCEEIASQIRVVASTSQVKELLAWAPAAERVWAVENANGLGRLLAQQLVAQGEVVIDVPATLASRARKLSGHSGRKTDEFDARSVVIAARHNRGLRHVMVENLTAVLGLLIDRRWQLVFPTPTRDVSTARVAHRARPRRGGQASDQQEGRDLPAHRHPPSSIVELERKLLAREVLEDIRSLDRRIPAANQRLSDALAAYATTLTDVHGIGEVGAATILSIVDDPTRFPTKGHFAAFTGTAPIEASSGDVRRHRLSRRGNRQMNKVLHTAARTQIRRDGPGRVYYNRKLTEGKSTMEALRALKRQLSDVVYRRLLVDHQTRAVRGGQMRTRP